MIRMLFNAAVPTITGKKVRLSLCLTKHHVMKTYWGNGGIAPRILDLGTKWEYSASRPRCFTPKERALGTYWIGGWVGPRAVLDTVVKRKIPRPCRESNPRTPIVQPVVSHYTEWASNNYRHCLSSNGRLIVNWTGIWSRFGPVLRCLSIPSFAAETEENHESLGRNRRLLWCGQDPGPTV
jgi:hypothetical protein